MYWRQNKCKYCTSSLRVKNTLAYHDTELIMALEGFGVQAYGEGSQLELEA
jgi:hypothetical protein